MCLWIVEEECVECMVLFHGSGLWRSFFFFYIRKKVTGGWFDDLRHPLSSWLFYLILVALTACRSFSFSFFFYLRNARWMIIRSIVGQGGVAGYHAVVATIIMVSERHTIASAINVTVTMRSSTKEQQPRTWLSRGYRDGHLHVRLHHDLTITRPTIPAVKVGRHERSISLDPLSPNPPELYEAPPIFRQNEI
jgi:hypothetical protein